MNVLDSLPVIFSKEIYSLDDLRRALVDVEEKLSVTSKLMFMLLDYSKLESEEKLISLNQIVQQS